eukprot:1157319-Pelagomonas_calceolata.AAC.6
MKDMLWWRARQLSQNGSKQLAIKGESGLHLCLALLCFGNPNTVRRTDLGGQLLHAFAEVLEVALQEGAVDLHEGVLLLPTTAESAPVVGPRSQVHTHTHTHVQMRIKGLRPAMFTDAAALKAARM